MTSTFIIKKLILAAIVLCSAISLPGAADERHYREQWRPAPLYQPKIIRNHHYVYYPQQQVYFSPSDNNWFWANGRGWQVSSRLPAYLNVDLRFGGIPIALRSGRPYAEHVYVERAYGRPWRDSYESRHYHEARRGESWRHRHNRDDRNDDDHGRPGHDRQRWNEQR